MTDEWRKQLDRMKSIGHLSHGRTRVTEKSGREHPESHLPFKETTDTLGNMVTEHSNPGSGVSCRQDVNIHPQTIETKTGLI